jgi:hypothetical protein
MIDDAMIKRLAVQCGSDAVTGEETTVREFFRKFARACYAAGQRDEREACAISCEVHASTVQVPYSGSPWSASHECAAAIRARTEGKT